MAAHSLHAIAKALGGIVAGRSVLAPGPGHGAKDRSLSVKLSATSPYGFMVYSHAGDDWQACRDHVRARLGLSPFKPGSAPPPRQRRTVEEAPSNNRDPALRIWREALDPRGSLVETYLKSRRLDLPDDTATEVIRFHPDCPCGRDRFPAMVCLVRNIVTDEPQAIHRTALAPDGTAFKHNGKTFRLSLGPLIDGAIKIDPDENVREGICVGEGVETCLAGRLMGLRPVWSVLNTSGIAGFPILPCIEGLHIFRENDPNGASAKATEACARRWYEADRSVFVVEPDIGNDLNDELQRVVR
jgi:putative DNA primase/helicase